MEIPPQLAFRRDLSSHRWLWALVISNEIVARNSRSICTRSRHASLRIADSSLLPNDLEALQEQLIELQKRKRELLEARVAQLRAERGGMAPKAAVVDSVSLASLQAPGAFRSNSKR